MKTTAVRLYGKKDLRLEEFELPAIKEDEILAKIISDSICMSSYKAAAQGADHKRVPDDVAENPVMLGHEFCGEIVEVGSKWADKFKKGNRFSIQPALNYQGSLDAPGYSYHYIGGNATYIVIPNEVMEMDCLLEYGGSAFFMGSLAEPMSCIVGAFQASYHVPQGTYEHDMGIREGGAMAILAGAGPMGLGTIDLALHGDRRPGFLVVTDIDDARLQRAEQLFTVEDAKKYGVELRYVNTGNIEDPVSFLKKLSPAVESVGGYDDVFVLAPVKPIIEQADLLLAKDGCMNFFAGPTNTEFSANINFYDVHYAFHHIVGTSGGNTEDMRISLKLMQEGRITPQVMVTHVGGIDSIIDTTLRLPEIPGGKKLMYTHKSCELTAIDDFAEKGKTDPFFKDLAEICDRYNGLWSEEAEKYFLKNAPQYQA
ncbi:MAG: zinc-binding dehydrogenase [Spirochaetales bacterium]|uniref:Zinc-binding dehydrogenase n=1 Tax=Candidatus Thalassospirochaeta sargassi TaxID=3119039 RepID=A0AAJ1IGR1_9SPIO|nr:zinc-binding dehydrogenase [Spirochaetales bacterium]